MFRLAALLKMTVRELGQRMDSAELSEWLAFDSLYGLPDSHMVTGHVCASVYRAFTGAKVNVEDFAPIYSTPRGRQTPEQMMAMLNAVAVRQNGREANGDGH